LTTFKIGHCLIQSQPLRVKTGQYPLWWLPERIAMRRTIRVYVLDKAHDINVHQRSKSVWIACGEHLGERIEVKGRTAAAAAKLWADAARYRSN